jgi:hypothetical protein
MFVLVFCPSQIPDPKTATKEKGEKDSLSYPFCSHKYHKIKEEFTVKRIIELFTQNFVIKIWVWDQGYGIRKKPILEPGSRGQRDSGSGIRNTAKRSGKNCCPTFFVATNITKL